MNIEDVVKECALDIFDGRGVEPTIRNALTEQAEAFKGELQAYDGMVRELTKTVEDMRAAQSVPVVGEPVAWVVNTPIRNLHFSKSEEIGLGGATQEPLYRASTHSITAAELASLREKAAEADELRKDAAVGAAIQRAAKELPDGYDLHIQVESGSASVSLYLPDTDGCIEFDIDDDNRLAAEVEAAIGAAIAQGKGE